MSGSPGQQPEARGPRAGAAARRWPVRRLARWAVMGLIAYVLLALIMMLFENSLIYFPSVYPDGDWNPRGLVFEDAWFEAPDGTRLHGWHVPHAEPRAVILFA